MKKILLFLIILFPFSIKAMNPDISYIDHVYSNRSGDKLYSGQLGYIYMDGKMLYCIDPFKVIGTNYYLTNNYEIKDDDLKYMQAVANYASSLALGNKEIYMAAQELIWERLIGPGKVSFTTELYGKGNIINIEDMKKYLDDLAKNFLKKPSFDGMDIKTGHYAEYVMLDSNQVLSNYEIVKEKDDPNIIKILGDDILIKVLSDKEREVKFVRKMGTGDLKIYSNGGANQVLADLNTKVEVVATIKVQAIDENFCAQYIYYVDDVTKELVPGYILTSIDGTYYSTDNSEIFTSFKTGKHLVKTDMVPYGYILPKDEIIELKNDDYSFLRKHYIYLKKPIGRLNIINKNYKSLKLYKNGGELLYEFSNNEKYDLDLGDYYITDENDNVLKEINFEYIDQYTEIIEKEIVFEKEETRKRKIDEIIDDKNINNEQVNPIVELIEQKEEKLDNFLNLENINEKVKSFDLPNTYDYFSYIKVFLILIICLRKLK